MKETTALWQLKQYNNWVCWAYEEKDGKPTKIPKNPHTGGNAQSNNPGTWGSFALAQAACQKYGFDGLAFMLDPAVVKLVGIDLDHCVNNGVVDPWALKIVKQLNSYTEISPSGKGLRIFIIGELPPNGRRKGNIEIYDSVRFLTVTGNHLPETPDTILDRSNEINQLHQDLWPAKQPEQQKPVTPSNLDDIELLEKARASHGEKFMRLWAGDWNGYDSHSDADLALCEIFNFHSQGNRDQIDRLFRQSGLMRKKWDERHYADGRTHGQGVVDKALTFKHRDPDFYKKNGSPMPSKNGHNNNQSATNKAQSDQYIELLRSLNYTFRMNELNDEVEVNGEPITDALRMKIRTKLRDNGYSKKLAAIEEAWIAYAFDHSYNPIKDYFYSLPDYNLINGEPWVIPKLASFFKDTDGLFKIWLEKWLVGCVAKVMHAGSSISVQNPMLTLVGPQNLGKSYFPKWLCSGLPQYFVEGPINTDDKDHHLRLVNNFIWEVGELAAVTRKQDREALKDFITRDKVKVRKPYGHFEIEKYSVCSMLGTANDDATGFLNDPTGTRRFLATELNYIDWNYSKLDISMVWAEAWYLFNNYTKYWELTTDERKIRDDINERFKQPDAVEDMIIKYYEITDDLKDFISCVDVREKLELHGMRGTERQNGMKIAEALRKLGVPKSERVNDIRGYRCLKLRTNLP